MPVEEGLGGFFVWFSPETQTFRHKTIYKTSQGRAINSLYVEDLKKAMEAFMSYEECINCKLGISVWICFKKTTCQVQSLQSTASKHTVRDKRSSYVIYILLQPPLTTRSWLSALSSNLTEISMTLHCLDQVFHILDFFFKGQLPHFFGGTLFIQPL